MKRTIKKLLISIVLTVLILSSLNFNYQVEATTNGYTADTAIEYVKSLVGQKIEIDGAYYYQCVDLIMAYELELSGFYDTGSAVDFGYNTLPDGWTRIQGGTPQKGDILIYSPTAGNPNGHVAIYESDYVTYHQNYGGEYVQRVTNHYTQMYDWYNNRMPYWGLIRPDFENKFIPEGSIQDIGDDFIAYITPKSNSNLAAQTTGTENGASVSLATKNENSQNQKWYFKKQSDGSYTIRNMYSGKYLDIENTGNTDHEKVQIWSGGSGDKQCWFVYSYNGGYRLVPRSSKDDLKAFDIGDDIKDGAKLQIYQAVSNNNEWQTFNIIKDLGKAQDIGDEFVAFIVPKSNSNLAAEAVGTDNGSNVQLGTKDNSEAQKWYFKKQSDGSYSIKNEYAGKYLDIYNTGYTSKENVQIWSGGSGDKQCWFIYSYNGGYRLVPRSSADKSMALDIGDNIKDGANLQIYYFASNGNEWQTFEIVNAYEKGDVNGDGTINSTDYLKILAHVKKRATLTQDEQTRADIDEDGNIDSTDYLKLLAYVKKKISSL